MRAITVDWQVVVFGPASVPLSCVGARATINADAVRLERYYGAALLVLGVSLFVLR
jgi:hypothetical protein